MRHRSFTRNRDVRKTPVSFDIEGETFNCRPDLPGTTIVEFADLMMGAPVMIAATQVLKFFAVCMEPEEHARFRKFADDPDREVDIETLGDVVAYLVEEYIGFPTMQPSASGPGQASTGDSSTATSPTATSLSGTPMPAEPPT